MKDFIWNVREFGLWHTVYYTYGRYYVIGWWAHSRLNKNGFRVGDIYEDCSYHPVLCTEAGGGDLWGISLIDGTSPRGCSVFHCGPVKMTLDEAVQVKKEWNGNGRNGYILSRLRGFDESR